MFEDTAGASREWQETSALAAPALLGAAAGLLLGDLMHRGARRGLALGLGALGVAREPVAPECACRRGQLGLELRVGVLLEA